MNPIALYLASGEGLYLGAAILLVVIGVAPWIRNRWLVRVRTLIFWMALAMMAMACPPFPWWVDGVYFAAVVAWLTVAPPSKKIQSLSWRRFRWGATLVLALLTIVLPAWEFPHRLRPVFGGPRADHVMVIGDSISAGIGSEQPWPAVMQTVAGVPVTNLAKPGAEVSDALGQAKRLTEGDRLIVIEIGGNDMISGVPSAEFERNLDRLLAACAMPRRTLIMFELPLLPHRIAYGGIQRRLAEKYQVQLIPKRFLIDVLGGADATSDGLHLGPAGAQRMAELMAGLLEPVLPPRGTTTAR